MNAKTILDKIETIEDLKREKSLIFGKNGEINNLRNKLKTASINEKKIIGKKITEIQNTYNEIFSKAYKKIQNIEIEKQLANEWEEVTMPIFTSSSLHPISRIENRMKEWFIQNGYYDDICNEVESDKYNFEKLNIPKNHPARDMHDTFYISTLNLLKTHNTSSTARMLEKMKDKPFSAFTIGKVYRNDTDDSTHSHQFTQCDFVSTGNVSFANLKWTLQSLIDFIFEKKVKTRIRPSYFPFTEPSLEMDIYHNGKWLEILGAGMLHKNVFKAAKIKKSIQGFAAGLGLERIAMIKYNIKDIRELYTNDLRFLNQFRGVE